MSTTETYYLIDFENVNEDGLSISEKLTKHNHIHLFYTKNTPKIDIKILNNLNSADLSTHKIPAGKQSLDMHLVSYLGYLIGSHKSNNDYVIISKDSDYDNIISFWKKQNNTNITRHKKISDFQKENKATNTTANNTNSQKNKETKTKKSEIKCQLNTEIQKAIINADFPRDTSNKVASIVENYYGEDKALSAIHNEIMKISPDYLKIYKIIKPIINKY